MVNYAVVVGISRYPTLAREGAVRDLDGPGNDALGVYEWLVDSKGGGLDPVNVRLICSPTDDQSNAADPQPASGRIEAELLWIEEQTRAAPADRLYLYFAGHGFSPVLEEGALLTAEARQVSPAYVYAHAWLRWFRQAQRFRESVLWMDCCMNYQQSIPVRPVLLRAETGTGVPGPAFVALAAQTKSALEHTMSDGKVHGVFTWTLLKGLWGGASDERGRITSESLKTFLYNVMPEFLPTDALSSAVDLQPFVRADEGMLFQRLPARPKHRVRLLLPGIAAGASIKVWGGRPHHPVVDEPVTGESWEGQLVRGLYVAEVAPVGLRQGFQVTGGGDVEVTLTEQGPPVSAADVSDLFSLDIVAGNPAAAITVTDYSFDRIYTATGELHEREAPGVYKIRKEFGRDISLASDVVVLLDRDFPLQSTAQALPAAPPFALAPPTPAGAPVERSGVLGLAPDDHFSDGLDYAAAARTVVRRGLVADTEPTPWSAGLSVVADLSEGLAQEPAARSDPLAGFQLLDASGAVVEARFYPQSGGRPAPGGAVDEWRSELAPGVYMLRHTLPSGAQFDSSVVVSPGWVTQCRLRGAVAEGAPFPISAVGEMSVFMRPVSGGQPSPDQDAAVDVARMALNHGRNLFGGGRGLPLEELLLQKYNDPMAGIVGCHLLLRAIDSAKALDPNDLVTLTAAVQRLRDLVGDDHPDVEAISLRCSDESVRRSAPFDAPPMFVASWNLMVTASYQSPDLVPLHLWQRVHASTSVGPILVWASDDAARKMHVDQLSRWIADYSAAEASSASSEGSAPDSVRDGAGRMAVPAAAAESLWQGRSTGERASSTDLSHV